MLQGASPRKPGGLGMGTGQAGAAADAGAEELSLAPAPSHGPCLGRGGLGHDHAVGAARYLAWACKRGLGWASKLFSSPSGTFSWSLETTAKQK
eukprot:8591866-Heterocapsa_arctica.AAC.1